eukprot:scaffold4052_cov213-Amphora_coffeaeformis.AAC.7
MSILRPMPSGNEPGSDHISRQRHLQFINTTNPVIGQHEGARFDTVFARFGIFLDGRRQTGGRTGLARRVDTAGCRKVVYIF